MNHNAFKLRYLILAIVASIFPVVVAQAQGELEPPAAEESFGELPANTRDQISRDEPSTLRPVAPRRNSTTAPQEAPPADFDPWLAAPRQAGPPTFDAPGDERFGRLLQQPQFSSPRAPSRYVPAQNWRPRNNRTQHALHSNKLTELTDQVRNEKDEDKRIELSKNLQQEMEVLFDDDLENRSAELVRLESRLAKLRSSVEKRKNSRDRIIRNRIETILLEADGLVPQRAAAPDDRPSYPPTASPFGVEQQARQVSPERIIEQYPDGSRKVRLKVAYSRIEARMRRTPINEEKMEKQYRTVDGSRQAYWVPTTQTRIEEYPYAVAVPTTDEVELVLKKGESVKQGIKRMVAEQKLIGATVDSRKRLRDQQETTFPDIHKVFENDESTGIQDANRSQ